MEPDRNEYEIERAPSGLPLSYQEKAIGELHEVVNVLAKRLAPILTPDHPTERRDDGAKETEPVQSPVAHQLHRNNNSINTSTAKLRSLIDRVEC